MWNEQKIEKYLKERLRSAHGNEVGDECYADYVRARSYLVENLYSNINIVEPNLTDHGPKHVANVLKNTWDLLTYHSDNGDEAIIPTLSALDVYVLCLSILFHDVGNINGRNEHNNRVWEVYKQVRGSEVKYKTERELIIKAAAAHCGKTKHGSRDTLREIDSNPYQLSGEPINLLEIASILRFADELAEGPQRTSDYLLRTDIITSESMIYHKYAAITNVLIDRGNGRIVMKYSIDIEDETVESLKPLLLFAYKRIIKMDEERRYAKFYSNLLAPFTRTEVTFCFSNNGEPQDIPINQITLRDTCVIPGENEDDTKIASSLLKTHPELDIDSLLSKLPLKKRKYDDVQQSVQK